MGFKSPIILPIGVRASDGYFYTRDLNGDGVIDPQPGANGLIPFKRGDGPVYFVADNGDDSNPGTETFPLKTINKGSSMLGPGKTVMVKGGNYVETTYQNAYVPLRQSSDTNKPAAVTFGASGTVDAPATIMAYPGHEGGVKLQCGHNTSGIMIGEKDFCQVYGLIVNRPWDVGIGRGWQASLSKVFDTTEDSEGCRIEKCAVFATRGAWGSNISGIGPWCTNGWIITDSLVDGVTAESLAGHTDVTPNGMQWYNAQGLKIISCTVRNAPVGIFGKDHYLLDATTRAALDESEIAYCDITAKNYGVIYGIMGTGTPRAGNNYVHHNLITGLTEPDGCGIMEDTSGGGANDMAGYLRAEHNVIHVASGVWGIGASAARGMRISGNIILGADFKFVIYRGGAINPSILESSDRNVFDAFRAVLNKYGSGSAIEFNDIGSWRGHAANARIIPATPDALSRLGANASMFVNAGARNYRLISGALAAGIMEDGSDAGCYQHGTETIGTITDMSSWTGD